MAILFAVVCILGVALTGGQNPSQEIAFSAGLTHHQLLSTGHNVVYDRIMTNVGSAYDTTTGVFTCPTPGIYVFQFHALARLDNTLYLELYHNTQYIASAYGHTTQDYAAGGNSVILDLAKGDTVSIKAAGDTQINLYGVGDEVYTTFSGFLIDAE